MAEPNLPGYANAAAVKSALDKSVSSIQPASLSSGATALFERGGFGAAFDGSWSSVARQSGITRLYGKIIHVSQDETNGFAVGNDTNDGKTKLTAKLTLSSAHSAAAPGDIILINDSETPYSSSFYSITKSICILPYSYRGVTIQSTSTSYVLRGNAKNIMIGSVIIDTNSVSAAAYQSTATPCDGLIMVGTLLKAHSTYIIRHIGPCYLYRVDTESVSGTPRILILPRDSGKVTIDQCNLTDGIYLYPDVTGIQYTVKDSKISLRSTESNAGIYAYGIGSALVSGCEISASTGSGILLSDRVGFNCSEITVRKNTVILESETSSGYGIRVGGESDSAASIGSVVIEDNEVANANHGIISGYGSISSHVRRNVIRNGLYGVVAKGSPSTKVYGNFIFGGSVSGGALRVKEAVNAHVTNNLIKMDSIGPAVYVSDGSQNAVVERNIILSSAADAKLVLAVVGTTAAFANNNYYSSVALGASAFSYDGADYSTLSGWQSIEPTATSVDPSFVGPADYRLTADSPLVGLTLPASTYTDFFGNSLGDTIGPISEVV